VKSGSLFNKQSVAIVFSLIVITFITYSNVREFGFYNYDDDVYVTGNQHVQKGLTAENIRWAFATGSASNWHPLTWLSLMSDYTVAGLNAGYYHTVNLTFHILNTVLLFLVFSKMTGAQWQSAFVASVFALHPTHIESVAWIAERKDVLSAFLWMMTIWAYIWYTKKPEFKRFIPTIVSLALGLMAKPMLVTLPFVLLLLDFWPLKRMHINKISPGNSSKEKSSGKISGIPVSRLIVEKLPLIALVVASSIITFIVQRQGGSMRWSEETLPFFTRIVNAVAAYGYYVVKSIWPDDIVIFYPHPGTMMPVWQIAGSAILIVGISFVVIRAWEAKPYLFVGWFWFLGTLLPVIGIVQVGWHFIAYRYMYIPLTGLAIMAAWVIPEISFLRSTGGKRLLFGVGCIVLAVTAFSTNTQLKYWKDSKSLFEHTLKVTQKNWLANNNLAIVLAQEGNDARAASLWQEAVRIKPDYVEAHHNLGILYTKKKDFNNADYHYGEALKYDSTYRGLHYSYGWSLSSQGKIDEAFLQFREAVRIDSLDAASQYALGTILFSQKKYAEGADRFRKVLEINRGFPRADMMLQNALRLADSIATKD
jgi:Tfp pilus assembly protein PilF